MSVPFKRLFGLVLTFALVLSVVLGGAPTSAAPKERSFVLLAANSLPANLQQQVQAAGGTVTRTLGEVGAAVATSRDPQFTKNVAKIQGVRAVVPNVKLQWIDPDLSKYQVAADVANPPTSGDDDELFDLQWGHDAIDAPEAWTTGARGDGVRVAVLDDGIDSDHPDLASNLNTALSASFVPGETYEYAVPNDPFSHGTHVAGTIAAADNGLGTIGVAPEAELVMVKVLSSYTGSGTFEGVAAGIVYAANIDADVINMSLGAYFPGHNYCDEDGVCVKGNGIAELVNMMKRATTYAFQQGTTIVASAGNDAVDRDHDRDGIHLPSDLPHLLSISATGPEGWALNPEMSDADLNTPAFYTNYGQSRIDLAAPGGDIDFDLYESGQICTVAGVTAPCWAFDLVYSTGSADAYYWSAGTSMAAPHVSGVAALIIGERGGSLQPAQVESLMRRSAEDLGKSGKDDFYGHGLVNAYNAVR